MCYYTNEKRDCKAISQCGSQDGCHDTDKLLMRYIISNREPSVAADGSLFLIGYYVYSYCQDYSGNAAHTSK